MVVNNAAITLYNWSIIVNQLLTKLTITNIIIINVLKES